MKQEARRDLIPMLILFAIALIGDSRIWFLVICLIPILFYCLYLIGLSKAKEEYVPQKSKKSGKFWYEMYSYDHPVVMPRFFYLFECAMMYLIGTCLFFLYPINMYFWNWGRIYMNMCEHSKTQPIGTKETIIDAQTEPVYEEKPKAARPQPQASAASTEKPKAPIPPVSAQQRQEQQILSKIEQNHQDLLDIQKTSAKALETVFGQSKLTQERYQSGIDSAVNMSAKVLQSAKDYVEIGHSLDRLNDYLRQSEAIHQKTGELLDALINHHQNMMKEDLDQLDQTLDDLKDSVKYYQ